MESPRQNGEHPVKPASFIEFVTFLALGGLAALTNLVARYFLNFVMPFEFAVVLAYICGMLVAFALFSKILFTGSEGALSRKVIRFTQVNILGAILSWLVSVGTARFVLPYINWTWRPLEVAHFLGVAAPAISSYLLHKRYTFA